MMKKCCKDGCPIVGFLERNSWLDTLARIVVGVVFIFSSVVKAVDPYGTVLKMDEYFVALGVEWLSGVGTVLAVGLITLEMIVGVMLLLRALPRTMAWVALVFNGFYLLLTFWIALTDPVAECGCFGDVLVLSNWQTFGKNVVLTLLSAVIFLSRGRCRACRWGAVISAGVGTATLAFTIYSLIALPVVERFPFGVGVNLPEAIEEDLISAADETFVVCRNVETDELRRFGVNDEEWWDETKWEFVSTDAPKEKLEVRVSEFRLWAGDVDITLQVLDAPVCHLLLVEDTKSLCAREREKMWNIATGCMASGGRTIIVTASPLIEVQEMFPGVEFANMDPVVMRALLRAPAGAVMLTKGTVAYKASLRHVRE